MKYHHTPITAELEKELEDLRAVYNDLLLRGSVEAQHWRTMHKNIVNAYNELLLRHDAQADELTKLNAKYNELLAKQDYKKYYWRGQ
jgi:hypothetical protein